MIPGGVFVGSRRSVCEARVDGECEVCDESACQR